MVKVMHLGIVKERQMDLHSVMQKVMQKVKQKEKRKERLMERVMLMGIEMERQKG